MKTQIAFFPMLLLVTGMTMAQPSDRGLPPSLFSSDTILASQEQIALSVQQKNSIARLNTQREKESRESNEEMYTLSQNFLVILNASKVDEQIAQSSLDKILALESANKKRDLLFLIRIKNVLTEDQQKKLKEVRKFQGH